ncbi:MAG: hypothetical protein EXS32_13030 [Opitutus sp.]|nr:hypothetical protein [Opitutus sp.]
MKKSDTHGYVNQLLAYLLVTICFGGSIGLGTVWMRHQISVTANHNRLLESGIVALERRLAEATTAIESEQTSDVLRRRNTEWSLGLAPATELQVVSVTEDPGQHLANRRSRELLSQDGPLPVSFKLALKN